MLNRKNTFVKKFIGAPCAEWANIFSRLHPGNGVTSIRTKSLMAMADKVSLFCFSSQSPCEFREIVLYFTSKAFSFLRHSDFRTL